MILHVLVGPEGILGCYHNSLPSLEEIKGGIIPGNGARVVKTPIARIGMAICFDLNFKELRDEYAALRPEIITFSSMSHGGLIQGIWAYECRSYFISSTCFEDCGILDPFGHPVALATDYARAPMAKINLDYVMVHLTHLLPKIADVRRKYREEVTVEVPAHVGAGLIFSNGPTRTAADIARELDLMPLDDYLTRCQEQCRKTREDDDVLKEAKP